LLEALRHRDEADFSAVFFRRNTVQVRNPGGLWDESFKLYPGSGAAAFAAVLEWKFPSGAKVKFAHLEHCAPARRRGRRRRSVRRRRKSRPA
jgi:hypothetical protein